VTLARIGVFDSGVGGLTVLKAISEQVPAHYFYFGDTARLPYGTKSAETVARYAIGAARFLEAQNIDLLVIACNTATALALPLIKEATRVPVVGVVERSEAIPAAAPRKNANGDVSIRPCRIGTSSGIRPTSEAIRISIGSGRSGRSFHLP